MMEVGRPSVGPMETNIDPRLQEEDSTTGSTEELVKTQVDPKEPSRVVKVGKCLGRELTGKLTKFWRKNQDVFAWTYANMVGIHPNVMCHRLNIAPQEKPVRQKRRELDVDRYKVL